MQHSPLIDEEADKQIGRDRDHQVRWRPSMRHTDAAMKSSMEPKAIIFWQVFEDEERRECESDCLLSVLL